MLLCNRMQIIELNLIGLCESKTAELARIKKHSNVTRPSPSLQRVESGDKIDLDTLQATCTLVCVQAGHTCVQSINVWSWLIFCYL